MKLTNMRSVLNFLVVTIFSAGLCFAGDIKSFSIEMMDVPQKDETKISIKAIDGDGKLVKQNISVNVEIFNGDMKNEVLMLKNGKAEISKKFPVQGASMITVSHEDVANYLAFDVAYKKPEALK